MEPKFLHDDDPWMLGEEIPNCDLFFSTIWLNGFVSYFDEQTSRAYKKILCKYEGYHLWFYFGERDSDEVGEHLAERLTGEPGYAAGINRNIIVESDKLRAFSDSIPQANLDKLADVELWQIYETHQRIHAKYYSWGWIPVAADMFHNNLTRRVKAYLNGLGVTKDKLNEYFVILTQPTEKSLIFIEQENLLKIAREIEKEQTSRQLVENEDVATIKERLPKDLLALVSAHRAKYYFTKHLWVSGEFVVDDYLGQIKELIKIGKPAGEILEKQYRELSRAKEKREALIRELGIIGQWREVLDAFGDFMVTKIYRRYSQLLAVHHMSAVLKEIARRKYLTEKQVRFATLDDVKKILLEDNYNDDELLARAKMCVYYAERGFEKVFTGSAAEKLLKSVEREVDKNISELRGETGCVGYAKGKVKIIIRAADMAKMNEGDILVSIATDPDIVPAMKKAAAIVTEQGGVTSHAAIVSRELGIPCVIGTKIATRVLKDGDLVEVDANQGIVKKL